MITKIPSSLGNSPVDNLFRLISAGNYIVYGTNIHSKPGLKYGKVSEIAWKDTVPFLKVISVKCLKFPNHDPGGYYRHDEIQNNGKPVIIRKLNRVMVIAEHQLPQNIIELLK